MTRRFITVLLSPIIACALVGPPAQALTAGSPAASASDIVLHRQADSRHKAGGPTFGGVDLVALQRALDGAVAAGVPGIVYLIRSGDRTRILTSGVSDLATHRPIRARDKFRVASITKTFVATAVLQLQQSGRIDLDAPISHYLPGLLPDGDAITARHLLGHTSGLFDYAEDPDWFTFYRNDPLHVWQPEELIERFSLNHPPNFAPGTDFGYSNTGYLVLGLLIEKVTGQPLERVLTRQIFKPLHLHDTSVPTEPAIRGPHAHGYTDFAEGDGYQERDLLDPSVVWASGAVVSTVNDVATFYRRLLTGKVLAAAQLAEMMTFRELGGGEGYGLGLSKQPRTCSTVIGHPGGGLGFSTDAETTSDGQRQAVVFANAENFPEAAYPYFSRADDLAFC